MVLEAVAAFTKKENIFDLGRTNPLRLEVLFYHSPPTQEWYLLQCESYLSFCADMETVYYTQMYALRSVKIHVILLKCKYLLGVPTKLQILTGDSQKLSFSILSKIPFLIF